MIRFAVLIALLAFTVGALAEGGQKRDKSPVINSDGEIVGVVDPNVDCTLLIDQSGKAVYFCVEAEDEGDD